MELLTALGLLFFSYVVFFIYESRASKVVFGIVSLIIGLFVTQEGLMLNTLTISTVNTPVNFVFVIILLFGGLYNMYNAAIEHKGR